MVGGHFLPGARGPVFALVRTPRPRARGCVLLLAPLAEEMNKSRRMLTEVAIALEERRIATVLPDYYGTGDSGGDFADSDWSCWLDDVAATSRWCEQLGTPLTGILAIRLGCALLNSLSAAGRLPRVETTVLWQPAFDGQRALNQFLRLRVMAARMSEGRNETLADLQKKLRDGEAVEVAGYEISSRLGAELAQLAVPSCLAPQLGTVHWMEVTHEPENSPPAATSRLIEATRASGNTLHYSTYAGEPFWASTEVVRVPAMIRAAVAAFDAGHVER
jgi:exosortase A-associated hydrolase 2